MDNSKTSRTLRSVRPQEPIHMPVKKAPGKPVFWWIYGAVLVVLCLLAAVALILLNNYLTASEASQPVHAAQAVFDRYFPPLDKADTARKNGVDFTEALKLCGFEVSGFEDVATVSAALRDQGKGRELFYYAVNSEEGTAQYHVSYAEPTREDTGDDGTIYVRDAQTIFIMTFIQSDEPLGFGFRGWKLESLAPTNLMGSESVKAVIPHSFHLTLNGRNVGEDRVVSSEPSALNEYLPDGAEGIFWDTYQVDGLYRAAQLACTDEEGKPVSLTQEKDGTYRAPLNYRQDLQAEYGDFVRRGIEEYARYVQDIGSINSVAQYFDTSSLFYRETRSTPLQWVITPSSCHFENETVDQFYAFSDDLMACRVDMVQVLVRGGQEYKDHLVMTVFLHRVNGSFRIFDRKLGAN